MYLTLLNYTFIDREFYVYFLLKLEKKMNPNSNLLTPIMNTLPLWPFPDTGECTDKDSRLCRSDFTKESKSVLPRNLENFNNSQQDQSAPRSIKWRPLHRPGSSPKSC
jgi:hypothetical protein